MSLLGYLLLLVVSFYVIARVVDVFFVETLEIISARLKLSHDIAGATFMAVGSSAPELMVSFLALTKIGSAQAIGAGTIVGSAIFNILVIIGASALVGRAVLTWQPVMRDLIFYVLCIVVLLATFSDGRVTLGDTVLFLGLYGTYLLSFGVWKRVFPYQVGEGEVEALEDEGEQYRVRAADWSLRNGVDKLLALVFVNLKKRPGWYMFNFVMAVVLLGLLSHVMVDAAVHVARGLGVSEVVIGLTILAAGTSIPDLISSMSVAKRGKGDMAVANAVGSNIFDIAIGLGLPWLVYILIQGEYVEVATENLISSVVLLLATVVALLFLLITRRWAIGRYAGVLLIGAYVFYLLTQLGWISWTFCVNLGVGVCVGM